MHHKCTTLNDSMHMPRPKRGRWSPGIAILRRMSTTPVGPNATQSPKEYLQNLQERPCFRPIWENKRPTPLQHSGVYIFSLYSFNQKIITKRFLSPKQANQGPVLQQYSKGNMRNSWAYHSHPPPAKTPIPAIRSSEP